MGAALISLFVPGLAHFLLGKPFQGLLFFVLVVLGYVCFVIPGIVLHLICIVDASRASNAATTKRMEQAIRRASK